MVDRFDKFTDRARRVLTFAQEEAMRLNHESIGPEHLLLGLVREGEGVAAKVLANMGVKLETLRSSVEFLVGRGERATLGEIGLTSAGKEIIRLAVVQAKSLGHHYIGTEHILLGLLAFPEENVASQVLNQSGVELEAVRKETERILARSIPGPLSGVPEEKRAKIEKALADSEAALDQFEVSPESKARANFEIFASAITKTMVRLIFREPGWKGFVLFSLDDFSKSDRFGETLEKNSNEERWHQHVGQTIWLPLIVEFANLSEAEISHTEDFLGYLSGILAVV